MKAAIVMGAGGFIGHHMVRRLVSEGYWVRGVDLKSPEYEDSPASEFLLGDLRDASFVAKVFADVPTDLAEVYQFAADMGGAGYIFTGENDASVMHNSALINLLVLEEVRRRQSIQKIRPVVFYSSSACVYPESIQENPETVDLKEESVYPAKPDSEYGWEKLFSERLYAAYSRNFDLDVRVARFHNVYGPLGTWRGGKEKAPAAICRKVLEAKNSGAVEVWGDGNQTRSFLYIDDCIEGVRRFVAQSNHQGPINIGSEEMVSISELVALASRLAGYSPRINFVKGPTGVKGRNSNNALMRSVLNWDYEVNLESGLRSTLRWIEQQMSLEVTL